MKGPSVFSSVQWALRSLWDPPGTFPSPLWGFTAKSLSAADSPEVQIHLHVISGQLAKMNESLGMSESGPRKEGRKSGYWGGCALFLGERSPEGSVWALGCFPGGVLPLRSDPELLESDPPFSSPERLCRPCSWGWQHFQDSCYLYSRAQAPWSQAVSACQGLDAQLVVVNSADEEVCPPGRRGQLSRASPVFLFPLGFVTQGS